MKNLVSEPSKSHKEKTKIEKIIEQKQEQIRLLCAVINKDKGRALKYSEEERKFINERIQEIKIIDKLIDL